MFTYLHTTSLMIYRRSFHTYIYLKLIFDKFFLIYNLYSLIKFLYTICSSFYNFHIIKYYLSFFVFYCVTLCSRFLLYIFRLCLACFIRVVFYQIPFNFCLFSSNNLSFEIRRSNVTLFLFFCISRSPYLPILFYFFFISLMISWVINSSLGSNLFFARIISAVYETLILITFYTEQLQKKKRG